MRVVKWSLRGAAHADQTLRGQETGTGPGGVWTDTKPTRTPGVGFAEVTLC